MKATLEQREKIGKLKVELIDLRHEKRRNFEKGISNKDILIRMDYLKFTISEAEAYFS